MLLCMSSMVSGSPSGLLLHLFILFSFEIIKNHVVVFGCLPCLFNLLGWEQFCLIFLFLFHHVDVFKKLGQLSVVKEFVFIWFLKVRVNLKTYMFPHRYYWLLSIASMKRFLLLVCSVGSGAKYDHLSIGVCWIYAL